MTPTIPVVSSLLPAATSAGGHPIHLHCDEAELSPEGDLAVTGWVVCEVGISGVTVFLDGEALGELSGRFETLDDSGRLVLRRDDGTMQTVAAGDVFWAARS